MSHWTPEDMPDVAGRIALVTGANSGIGFHTALELTRHGARTLLACRHPGRAEDAAARIAEAVPRARGTAEAVTLDLASLDSVEDAAAEVADRTAALDILVNNAGVMIPAARRTADGFELQFGINHLGHFALTGRLLPLLLAAEAPRVVTVGSLAHRSARSVWPGDEERGGGGTDAAAHAVADSAAGADGDDDGAGLRRVSGAVMGGERGAALRAGGGHGGGGGGWRDESGEDSEREEQVSWSGYARSKLANLMFARELDHRARSARTSLISVAVHPGYAATELLAKSKYGSHSALATWLSAVIVRTTAQSPSVGAWPSLYAATMNDLTGGEYIGPRGPGGFRGAPVPAKMSRSAQDDGAAASLWEYSVSATGVGFEELGR